MARILVIEDEKPLRESVVEGLTYEGFEVIEAVDGEEGITLAQQHKPDLIVSDIAMPNKDGYKVLLELRQHPETVSIPLIFLTAKADRTFMRHGMELGADDYLTKPFTSAELLAAVRSRLERRQSLESAAETQLAPIKKRLMRLVSHELRTPLVGILTAQDLLSVHLDMLSSEQIRDMVNAMQAGSNRLSHLVEQMVLMMQLDTNTLSYEAIVKYGFTSPLWPVLTSALNGARTFAYRNREGDIRLAEHQRDALIRCHSHSLSHALAEIIANALSFSSEGQSVRVTQWADGQNVYIEVADQGAGMTADQIQQALKPFEQVDRDTKEQQGIGLGLTIAQQVIAAHGGSLYINSQVGSGTQVTVQLPLSQMDINA